MSPEDPPSPEDPLWNNCVECGGEFDHSDLDADGMCFDCAEGLAAQLD